MLRTPCPGSHLAVAAPRWWPGRSGRRHSTGLSAIDSLFLAKLRRLSRPKKPPAARTALEALAGSGVLELKQPWAASIAKSAGPPAATAERRITAPRPSG